MYFCNKVLRNHFIAGLCGVCLLAIGCSKTDADSHEQQARNNPVGLSTNEQGESVSPTTRRSVFKGHPPIVPMPVISRNVPVYTSKGNGALSNDELYSKPFGAFSASLPYWIAYDISSIPAEQREQLLVAWYNPTYAYFERVGRAPGVYTIDGHTAVGGGAPPADDDSGWVTLASVSAEKPNIYHSRQHLVKGTDGKSPHNWIRLNISALAGGLNSLILNMDIHSANQGATDSWLFCGDSITAGAMFQSEVTKMDRLEGPNFAQVVNAALSDFFPAQENTGRGGWTTGDAVGDGRFNTDSKQTVMAWLAHFPGRYVPISFGTNDAGFGLPVEKFYRNYVVMVEAVIAAGKIPIVPTIPWAHAATVQSEVPKYNAQLKKLKKDYPEIVDGPDFWKYFSENPTLISNTVKDKLHPTEEGSLAYRRLWAEKMIEEVYSKVAASKK